MNNIPQSMDMVQRDILYFNLALNNFFQGADKELLTEKKIIIPSINKINSEIDILNTSLINFITKTNERIKSINERISSLKDLVSIDWNNLRIKNEIEKNIETYNKIVKDFEEIKLDIKKIYGDEIIMFVQKMNLSSQQEAVLNLKATEVNDYKKQFQIYKYDKNSCKYKLIDYELNTINAPKTAYEFYTFPFEMRLDPSTDELIFKNTSEIDIVVYVFK